MEKRTLAGTVALLCIASVSVFGGSLPSFYGIYASAGKKLTALKKVPVTTVFGLVVSGNSDRGMAVDGFSSKPGNTFTSHKLSFIIYSNEIDVNSVVVSPLEFTTTMTAYQFNILNTNPQFFGNVYGKGYDDPVVVNLWQAHGTIPLQVGPVPDKPGMYRLVPQEPLPSGKYALYSGKSLHNFDIVFTASGGRQDYAYYFEIK